MRLPEPGCGSAWDNALAGARARWHLHGADELGSRVRVWERPALTLNGTLRVGDRVRIFSLAARTELVVQRGATLDIGSRTFINYGCSISAAELVRIGPRCNVGSHVIIMDNDFHSLDPEHRLDIRPSAPIILEENVWIGVRATGDDRCRQRGGRRQRGHEGRATADARVRTSGQVAPRALDNSSEPPRRLLRVS